MTKSIDQMLSDARSRISRIGPEEAAAAVERGALLIDIRPQHQRIREGEVPAALVIERNVLEWRMDPQAETHIPQVTGYDQSVVVMCSEGYTSSLAAAALQEIGFKNATDLEGGFKAWEAAGLPTQPGGQLPIP